MNSRPARLGGETSSSRPHRFLGDPRSVLYSTLGPSTDRMRMFE